MSDLKGYRCSNCGQMLPVSKTKCGICTCEFCGSEYKVENYEAGLRIEQIPFKAVRFAFKGNIPRECCHNQRDAEEAFYYTIESMSKALAEKLMTMMDITVYQDYRYADYKVSGSVRVALPMDGEKSPAEAFRNLFDSKVEVESAYIGTRLPIVSRPWEVE